MGEIKKVAATILTQKEIAPAIFELILEAPEVAANAKPGQFVNVYLKDKSKILPRPISLCGFDKEAGTLRLVYRAGRNASGTKELSEYEGVNGESGKAPTTVEITGPLGNGFTLEGSKPLLIGGGIGIPPMLQLCKNYVNQGIRPVVALGYRTAGDAMYLYDEFKAIADVIVSTDDGTFGTKGTVVDAIKYNGIHGEGCVSCGTNVDRVYACGPTPMLRGVKALGEELGVKTYVSMEERMACGVGACLACVCKTTEVDGHSHVNNARVCKEGPVFDATMLDL